jgi:hypothetical protein
MIAYSITPTANARDTLTLLVNCFRNMTLNNSLKLCSKLDQLSIPILEKTFIVVPFLGIPKNVSLKNAFIGLKAAYDSNSVSEIKRITGYLNVFDKWSFECFIEAVSFLLFTTIKKYLNESAAQDAEALAILEHNVVRQTILAMLDLFKD